MSASQKIKHLSLQGIKTDTQDQLSFLTLHRQQRNWQVQTPER